MFASHGKGKGKGKGYGGGDVKGIEIYEDGTEVHEAPVPPVPPAPVGVSNNSNVDA
jgi:hypothetical protein